jgi:CheY-like chemotaxis protein
MNVQPQKLLIAEDDSTSRNMLAAILRNQGFEVVSVSHGAAALEAFGQPDGPNLGILDWMMPGMDGLEVCRRLRSLPSDQPPYLILLTSRDRKEFFPEFQDLIPPPSP